MKPKPTIFSVDPGINGTGIAVWDEETFKELNAPIDRVTLTATKHNTWENRARTIMLDFYSVVLRYSPSIIYCEYPAYFHSQGGKMVAERGDLVKLAVLAGSLFGIAVQEKAKWEWVQVTAWKGQLPKRVTQERIKNLIGITFETEHVYDAVGIGLYKKGYFQ